MSEPREFHASKLRRFPPAVKYLIILNVIAFVATLAAQYLWGIDLYEHFALFYPESIYFKWYQLVTHIFLHGNYLHILINMFVLWMFGTVLESVWKAPKFLTFYFITGLGAAALHLFVWSFEINDMKGVVNDYLESPSYENYQSFVDNEVYDVPGYIDDKFGQLGDEWAAQPQKEEYIEESKEIVQEYKYLKMNIPTVGASGAVFGLLMAFGLMFPNVMLYLYFFIPIKAKYFIILLIIFELVLGLTSWGGNIANFAHLGGMLFGFILLKIWGEKRIRIIKRRQEPPEYGEELNEDYFR